ncbi:MASE4 domain-containing protein [Actinoplanes sp. NPDC000266]
MSAPPDQVPATTVRIGRAPLAAAAVVAAAATMLYLLPDRQFGSVPAFMPSFLAVVWVLDALTAFLLFTQYAAGGSARLLTLGGAYLWSSAVVVPHALVFPGLFSPAGLLGAVPSSAPWLWTAWHVGFPALIGLAMAPWPKTWESWAEPRRSIRWRATAIGGVCALAVLGVTAVAWLVTAGSAHLPTIIEAGDYSVLTHRFGPWIVAVNVVALLSAATRFRAGAGRGLEAWAFVAVSASCGDAVLVLYSRSRFTLGWYGARVLALVAALVVLTSLLREVTLLYRRVRASAEELARNNEELTAANAVRDHLVAVVSHELRTPLTALTGVVEILREGRDVLPPAKVDDMLMRADALTRRLSMLTEDLLAVSTIGHGQLHVSPLPLDVREALRECAAMFPNTDVRVECPDGVRVDADPLRLQQILANFVRNAVKYGKAPVILSADAGRAEVDIRVRDHGEGVPEEFVPRLFDRFTRSEKAKTGSTAGAGLGLSIAATLAEAHHGRAWYEPRPDGACFVLTLPARPEPVEKTEPRAVTERSH